MIDYNKIESENEIINYIDTTYVELGQDMVTNILNIKCASV